MSICSSDHTDDDPHFKRSYQAIVMKNKQLSIGR